jgi:endonuclease YncB( thermonuclease family)
MAARTDRTRSACSAAGVCLVLAACTDPELSMVPRPDTAVQRRLVGPATVIDAGTLMIGGRTLELWGIDAPARDAQCAGAAVRAGESDAQWPCGEHAAAALAAWLGTRSVNCDPRAANADGSNVAMCRLNGRDVGKWLVMQGWARDAPVRSGGMYRTLERAAAGKRRGLHGARETAGAPPTD